MTEHIKTPELRFSNFLDMWHIHKLSDVATITGGGTPSTKVSEYWDGEIDWYTPNEIGERIYARGSKKKITNLGYKKSSTKLLPINTILFTSRAGIGNTAILAKEGCTNQGFQSIIPNSEKIDSYFIYTISNHIKKYALKHAAGSTFLEISGKELGKMKLFLPSLKEQQKIGVFFSKLDRQIELEEEKLELLEQQKRGYMQKIFSQELRFKDDNGNSYPDWSIKKIEDISKVNKGFTPNTKNDEYWDKLNENWLSIAGMTQKYLYKGNKGITEKGASKHVKVDKDTLIMSFKLTLGKLAIVKEPIYTNEAICHFVWKESNVNTEYMYYYLNSINISTFGAQAVKGVTLNNDSINSIIVKLPVIQEQNKIAYFFNELDKLIRKQYAKIEVLKQRKKGLLQKMFV
ncbi:restriction endonuclease subunit S [Staphylococcus aureus]|uniref:restriction endonuclease subunit S n=1 Tax=Staphylococcus aureus TaxID=1280 RepID=UPI002904CA4A|nr:restriction endonuclease subunit S [Staphylococcus aureus]MDU0635158.1 restriction endonuclease subunit S [Staphylococcus aureus]MDU9369267.1 restriction endonuclease subunit S [Staphylococcus aureus]